MNLWKLRWIYKNLALAEKNLNQKMNMLDSNVMAMVIFSVACVNVIKDGKNSIKFNQKSKFKKLFMFSRTGTFCACPTDTTNATTKDAIENLCRQPLGFDRTELGPICSNRGECDCGNCFCFDGFNGKYCECPDCDIDCDLERADCICGECVCKYGWSGNSCNCKDSTDGCIGPNGEICSGRGYCECGECLCDEPYRGRFCEIGSDTENKLCAFYEPCVTCLIEEKTNMGKCEKSTEICSSAEQNEKFTTAFVTEEIGRET